MLIQRSSASKKFNGPSVEPFVANHCRVIDKQGIRSCIGWRHRQPGIRSDPKRWWTFCVCCQPTGWQRGRRHSVEVFSYCDWLPAERTRCWTSERKDIDSPRIVFPRSRSGVIYVPRRADCRDCSNATGDEQDCANSGTQWARRAATALAASRYSA